MTINREFWRGAVLAAAVIGGLQFCDTGENEPPPSWTASSLDTDLTTFRLAPSKPNDTLDVQAQDGRAELVTDEETGDPVPVPDGASAVCRDGTYSFSRQRSGTCSRHGGVAHRL